jgi:hypothetical protein
MAKEEVKYKYKSRFGSHKEMIVETDEANGIVFCEDEEGVYQTTLDRIDTGLVDPRRYAEERLVKLLGGTKRENNKQV